MTILKARMARVYVAGPFRAKPDVADTWKQHENIERASRLSTRVWELGAAGFAPHKNTENLQGHLPDHAYLAGDLAWLEVADAMILVEGWETSQGTLGEIEFARARGIPVFETLGDLQDWLGKEMLFYGYGR